MARSWLSEWSGPDSEVGATVLEESEKNLAAYRAQPNLVREHANIELKTFKGGYENRQLYELIQNGADAIDPGGAGGRIHVVLTEDALYCANEGEPIDRQGVINLLAAHVSNKRKDEIGRFGIGFKSLLGISDNPRFLSRTGSFEYDKATARSKSREIVRSARDTPILRIAEPIDPAVAAGGDEVLKELMKWAATVVHVPLKSRKLRGLSANLAEFPAEFCLFSSHVSSLVLEDRANDSKREISIAVDNEVIELTDQGETKTWRLFKTMYAPSRRAKTDAGELTDRDEVPLAWAVPIDHRYSGKFWAFFPTEYETTLSGVLNAPWKTNEDRQNLLRGRFNEELLNACAELVIDQLPELVDDEDPGKFLELLPGRGRENRNWADGIITDEIYKFGRNRPSLPDQDGRLRHPPALSIHPSLDVVSESVLMVWAGYENRPVDWVHPTVNVRDRRARAVKLMGEFELGSSLSDWLEALCEDGSPEASLAALRTAELLVTDELRERHRIEIFGSRILLTESGDWVGPRPGKVFFPSAYAPSGDHHFVHQHLCSTPQGLEVLERLGIGEIDAESELEQVVTTGLFSTVHWTDFWRLVRNVDEGKALSTIENRPGNAAPLHVKVKAGEFEPIGEVLLAGPVAGEDDEPQVVLDAEYHEAELGLLKKLGLSDKPTPDGGSKKESWFSDYMREAMSAYEAKLKGTRKNPVRDRIVFEEENFVGPMAPLIRLSDEGRARFTEAVLHQLEGFEPWHLAHASKRDTYPVLEVPSPVYWLLRKEGRLPTSLGVFPVGECVGPGLGRYSSVMPVASVEKPVGEGLGLPDQSSEIPEEVWQYAMSRIDELDTDLLALFYADAAEVIPPPDKLRCVIGEETDRLPPGTISVVTEERDYDALRANSKPALLARPEVAEALVRLWDLSEGSDEIATSLETVPNHHEVPFLDEFPRLGEVAGPDLRDLKLQRCSSVTEVTRTPAGSSRTHINGVIADGVLYWDERGDDGELLRFVDMELGLELGDEILTALEDDPLPNRLKQVKKVRLKKKFEAKLLAAVPVEKIRSHIPAEIIGTAEAEFGELSDENIASLARAVFGVDLLKELSGELRQAGLEPPGRWAGGRQARSWVKQLGFPREFAGFEGERRDPLLEVDGPPDLPPLHTFQETAREKLKEVVRGDDGNRGLMSLPTGAGKTRVTVQGLVEMIRDAELEGPILWVAQTDELCEQGVRTWSEVWRAIGPNRRLAVSRLWSNNDVEEVADSAQIVVATISKLDTLHTAESGTRHERYKWLSTPTCVVIDEAHRSTTPEYTRLLKWLEIDGNRRSRPLVGLTATPFRGTNVAETKRLVSRYGGKRIDEGAFEGDAYEELQESEVLAQVTHEVLAGQKIELSRSELAHLKKFHRLPPEVEVRIGEDRDRNRVLLDSITKLPEDWPVLVFASSVSHARSLAAVLTLRGKPSAAISSETPTAARRFFVEEFRNGAVKVLTNYGVFTEGFDAPAVRAVYVGRPTYSPNLYQQMIGRGLRGPKNGGKPECLLVDVADNIENYNGELAFTEFEGLWAGGH